MNIRENIFLALEGKRPNKIPFTMYMGNGIGPFCQLIPYGETGRYLRNKGLGIAYRTPAYTVASEDIEVIEKRYLSEGYKMIRTVWRGKGGEVCQVSKIEKGFGSEHVVERFVKEDKDYVILEDILKSQQFVPEYSRITRLQKEIADDGVVIIRLDKTPVNRLMYEMVGIEKFSFDLYDNKPELLSLIDTLNKKYDELIDLISESTAKIIQIPDNITAPMTGKAGFKKYCTPIYNKALKKLTEAGKILCIHMDGQLAGIANEINECDITVVEAFTPPPEGDLSLKEAREKWPGKTIWINFPCSMHLESTETIKEYTRGLLEEVDPRSRFLFGATESFPNKNMKENVSSILDVLGEY